jgi:hypothetical protein
VGIDGKEEEMMKQGYGRTVRPPFAPSKGEVCAHYWLCDPPGGETSKAECKLCGEVREFRNAPSFIAKEDEIVCEL